MGSETFGRGGGGSFTLSTKSESISLISCLKISSCRFLWNFVLFYYQLSAMNAFPVSFIPGISVLSGGWQRISTSYVKLPGNYERKLKIKDDSSPGRITLLS